MEGASGRSPGFQSSEGNLVYRIPGDRGGTRGILHQLRTLAHKYVFHIAMLRSFGRPLEVANFRASELAEYAKSASFARDGFQS